MENVAELAAERAQVGDQGLRRRGHGTLCFHGPPGTGKTALAESLAAACNLPLFYLQGMEGLTLADVDDIIGEVSAARVTERGTRADDKASEAAMEDRKKAGYF